MKKCKSINVKRKNEKQEIIKEFSIRQTYGEISVSESPHPSPSPKKWSGGRDSLSEDHFF